MDAIQAYVKRLFLELPRNNRSLALREEMLCNAQEKYDALLESGAEAGQAEREVIAEIGTAKDIRREYRLGLGRDQWVLLGVSALVCLLSLGLLLYCRILRGNYLSEFSYRLGTDYFLRVAAEYLVPFLLCCFGLILLLFVLRRLALVSPGLVIPSRPLRWSMIIIALLVISLYSLILCNHYSESFPSFLKGISRFVEWQVLAQKSIPAYSGLLPGLCLYFGLNKA